MMTRVTRLVTGLFGYYVVYHILSFFLNKWILGTGGDIASNCLQMFYVSFIFPWCIKHAENKKDTARV